MGKIKVVDLALGEVLPKEFINALLDSKVEKHAHNASFERQVFRAMGYDIPISQWHCNAVKSAYCGLPLSLAGVSKALNLGEKGKSSTGTALIKFFCIPIKPTKRNGYAERNYAAQNPEKWEEFKKYCIRDVEAEREIGHMLRKYIIGKFERQNYILDQQINDRGIMVDIAMAEICRDINYEYVAKIKAKITEISGVENPNSPKQLKDWLGKHLQREVKSLAKDDIDGLIEEAGLGAVTDVLNYRKKIAKTSTTKYVAMLSCACDTHRVYGLFQFYGANRTGRWAGRLVQLQNLPRNYISDLDDTREVVKLDDYQLMEILFEDISDILSQLIRTAFIAKPNHTFVVADFSAIEARVLSWLAKEEWREEVFRSHGKIYEASAAMMFNVPIEQVTKGSDLRHKGKTAELALGYQGSVGAMARMGAEDMGMSTAEMKAVVNKWRKANPKIVKLWYHMGECMFSSLKKRGTVKSNYEGITFHCDDKCIRIELPSGRSLYYWDPVFKENTFGQQAVAYRHMEKNQWIYVETYGGKIVENIVQAISRDLLADSMLRLDKAGFNIVMHVHDEAVAEQPNVDTEESLQKMCDIMGEDIPWAKGLPLKADGYVTRYYKKD
jgi:DNA polymerase